MLHILAALKLKNKCSIANKGKIASIFNFWSQESDFLDDDGAGGDSDYAGGKKGRKRGSAKHQPAAAPAQESAGAAAAMPTIEEVCTTFGLTDVELKFTDTDFQNLTTYKLFQQHVRPLLAKENPKVGSDRCFISL